jgi:predicted transcriptional regulator
MIKKQEALEEIQELPYSKNFKEEIQKVITNLFEERESAINRILQHISQASVKVEKDTHDTVINLVQAKTLCEKKQLIELQIIKKLNSLLTFSFMPEDSSIVLSIVYGPDTKTGILPFGIQDMFNFFGSGRSSLNPISL